MRRGDALEDWKPREAWMHLQAALSFLKLRGATFSIPWRSCKEMAFSFALSSIEFDVRG